MERVSKDSVRSVLQAEVQAASIFFIFFPFCRRVYISTDPESAASVGSHVNVEPLQDLNTRIKVCPIFFPPC